MDDHCLPIYGMRGSLFSTEFSNNFVVDIYII